MKNKIFKSIIVLFVYGVLLMNFQKSFAQDSAHQDYKACEQTFKTYVELESLGEFLSSESYFSQYDYLEIPEDFMVGNVFGISKYKILTADKKNQAIEVVYTVVSEWDESGHSIKVGPKEVSKKYDLIQSQNQTCRLKPLGNESGLSVYVLEEKLIQHFKKLKATKKTFLQQLDDISNTTQRIENNLKSARLTLEKYILMDGLGHFSKLNKLNEFHSLTNFLFYPFEGSSEYITSYSIKFLKQSEGYIQFAVHYTLKADKEVKLQTYDLKWNGSKWLIENVPTVNYYFSE